MVRCPPAGAQRLLLCICCDGCHHNHRTAPAAGSGSVVAAAGHDRQQPHRERFFLHERAGAARKGRRHHRGADRHAVARQRIPCRQGWDAGTALAGGELGHRRGGGRLCFPARSARSRHCAGHGALRAGRFRRGGALRCTQHLPAAGGRIHAAAGPAAVDLVRHRPGDLRRDRLVAPSIAARAGAAWRGCRAGHAGHYRVRSGRGRHVGRTFCLVGG